MLKYKFDKWNLFFTLSCLYGDNGSLATILRFTVVFGTAHLYDVAAPNTCICKSQKHVQDAAGCLERVSGVKVVTETDEIERTFRI